MGRSPPSDFQSPLVNSVTFWKYVSDLGKPEKNPSKNGVFKKTYFLGNNHSSSGMDKFEETSHFGIEGTQFLIHNLLPRKIFDQIPAKANITKRLH